MADLPGPDEIVDGRTFGPGEIVEMDNRLFRNCIFNDCVLVYRGGGFGWDGTNDFRPRAIRFAGHAAQVVAFAGRFGFVFDSDTDVNLELEVPTIVAEQFKNVEHDGLPFPVPDHKKSH